MTLNNIFNTVAPRSAPETAPVQAPAQKSIWQSLRGLLESLMLMIAPSSNSMFSGLSESTGGDSTFVGRFFGGMVSGWNYEHQVIAEAAELSQKTGKSARNTLETVTANNIRKTIDNLAQERSDEGWQRHWNKTMDNRGYNNGVPGNALLTAQPVIPTADVQPFPVATPRVPGG